MASAEDRSKGQARSGFDPNAKYVRITGVRGDLIEFDFAIGDPTIYVELMLPYDAFQEFCARNNVRHLTAEEAALVDYDRAKWRYGKPGIRE